MTAGTACVQVGPARSGPTWLFFDIDSTLITAEACRAHIAAVYAAMRSVYGVPDPAAAGLRFSGMTDLGIARDILAALSYPPGLFPERSAEFCREAARQHADLCPDDLTGFVFPGIPNLLTGLSARQDVRLGLLTGNIQEIALLKLIHAGLAPFFAPAVGAFGCDAEDRLALAPIARARAGDGAGPHPRERTLIIGDTPRDIACAHADGIRCVAVTTGRYDARQLAAANLIARDAAELAAILNLELGSLLPAQPLR